MFIIKLKLKTSHGEKLFYACEGSVHTPSKEGAKIFENKADVEQQAALLQSELIGVGTVTIEPI